MISYYQQLENFLNVTWRHAEDADVNLAARGRRPAPILPQTARNVKFFFTKFCTIFFHKIP